MRFIQRIDWHLGQYWKDMANRPAVQHGVYSAICYLIALNEGPVSLSDRRLRGLIKIKKARLLEAAAELVGEGVFDKHGDMINHKTTEAEALKARKRLEDGPTNGRQGGRPPSKFNELKKPLGYSEETSDFAYQTKTNTKGIKEHRAVYNTARDAETGDESLGSFSHGEGYKPPSGRACFIPTPSTVAEVRKIAPDWDVQWLVKKYLEYHKSSAAKPQEAFIGWVKKFTKGRKPT